MHAFAFLLLLLRQRRDKERKLGERSVGRRTMMRSFVLFLLIFLSSRQGGVRSHNCFRPVTRGVFYRGTVSVTQDGCTCLHWTSQPPDNNALTAEKYPNAGLDGNHNFCRNPQKDADTKYEKPWCFVANPANCAGKAWDYCNVPQCEDLTCFSRIDNGAAYRGDEQISVGSCVDWVDSEAPYDDASNAAAFANYDLTENKCRNPEPYTRDIPWCFARVFRWLRKVSCRTVPICDDLPHINTCNDEACVFPFVYDGFTFVDSTKHERGALWCATGVTSTVDRTLTTWDYTCQDEATTSPPLHSVPTGLSAFRNVKPQFIAASSTTPTHVRAMTTTAAAPTENVHVISSLSAGTTTDGTTTAGTTTAGTSLASTSSQPGSQWAMTASAAKTSVVPYTHFVTPSLSNVGGISRGHLIGYCSGGGAIFLLLLLGLVALHCYRCRYKKTEPLPPAIQQSQMRTATSDTENGYEIPAVSHYEEHIYEQPFKRVDDI